MSAANYIPGKDGAAFADDDDNFEIVDAEDMTSLGEKRGEISHMKRLEQGGEEGDNDDWFFCDAEEDEALKSTDIEGNSDEVGKQSSMADTTTTTTTAAAAAFHSDVTCSSQGATGKASQEEGTGGSERPKAVSTGANTNPKPRVSDDLEDWDKEPGKGVEDDDIVWPLLEAEHRVFPAGPRHEGPPIAPNEEFEIKWTVMSQELEGYITAGLVLEDSAWSAGLDKNSKRDFNLCSDKLQSNLFEEKLLESLANLRGFRRLFSSSDRRDLREVFRGRPLEVLQDIFYGGCGILPQARRELADPFHFENPAGEMGLPTTAMELDHSREDVQQEEGGPLGGDEAKGQSVAMAMSAEEEDDAAQTDLGECRGVTVDCNNSRDVAEDELESLEPDVAASMSDEEEGAVAGPISSQGAPWTRRGVTFAWSSKAGESDHSQGGSSADSQGRSRKYLPYSRLLPGWVPTIANPIESALRDTFIKHMTEYEGAALSPNEVFEIMWTAKKYDIEQYIEAGLIPQDTIASTGLNKDSYEHMKECAEELQSNLFEDRLRESLGNLRGFRRLFSQSVDPILSHAFRGRPVEVLQNIYFGGDGILPEDRMLEGDPFHYHLAQRDLLN